MYLIGIAGGSGSGKTTFAQRVIKYTDHAQAAILHQDSYYLATPPEHPSVHGAPNFDHPNAFDWKLLKEHLVLLKAGHPIETPIYDFSQNLRTQQTIPVGPCKVVLIEGIFALWSAEIRALLDLRVFLNVEADIRFIRRMHRDVRERSRSLDSIIRQYYDTVRPMHHEFLEPTRQYADLIVGEETDLAADVLAAKVREVLNQHQEPTE